MALSAPSNERKRVKVYELRENDWHDQGTGFCNPQSILDQCQIVVDSEDSPGKKLLESRIKKEDSYQKQQDTLIVWTDKDGIDMALSFQEADGCGMVCDAIGQVQQRPMEDVDDPNTEGNATGLPSCWDHQRPMEDVDDPNTEGNPVALPRPSLRSLMDIEDAMRLANQNQFGRDSMTRLILQEEYIKELNKLVEEAEDLESIEDLHKLCNIMKTIILFNDSQVIEYVVRDEVVLGVVGALEYDQDFPKHKANHRQFLSDETKFREVIPIEDPEIRRKIHATYRLQYLKDVVLARILDDPTFTVLNSLIFFNQVDIVQYMQSNVPYLRKVFGLIDDPNADPRKKREAVLLIQQSCAIAKNLQAPARASLYENLINEGLFSTITFAVQHKDATVRVAGADILVALIDHSALMTRQHVIKAISEGTKPMTETLIDLLLIEKDIGVKSQLGDALKVLLDPNANGPGGDDRLMGPDASMRLRSSPVAISQSENFLEHFYKNSAGKLFQPLKALENQQDLSKMTVQESALYVQLIDILCFFMRQHGQKGRNFILEEGFSKRIVQLLDHAPEKHLRIHAVKYFRTIIAIKDEFHLRSMVSNNVFPSILQVVQENLHRDNLLNSVCLELFNYIRVDGPALPLTHLVEDLRETLDSLLSIDVFRGILLKYEQRMNGPPEGADGTTAADSSFMTSEVDTPNTRHITINGGASRWQSLREPDLDEEAYFNTSDDEEDELAVDMPTTPEAGQSILGRNAPSRLVNGLGASPLAKPLVDYDDDDADEIIDAVAKDEGADTNEQSSPLASNGRLSSDVSRPSSGTSPSSGDTAATSPAPLSRPPSSKRMREEDEEDDELTKLTQNVKRRTSNQNLRAVRHNSGSPGLENKKPGKTANDIDDSSNADDSDKMDTDEKTTNTKSSTPLRQSARRKEKELANGKSTPDAQRPKRISISLGKQKES